MTSVPIATYRLQLHAAFTFEDAAAIAPYLRDLGVSHLYLSPILQSAHGSTHGYDATDPSRIDAERGGPEGLERLLATCREHNLRVVLDIVPNHLDVSSVSNPYWKDVLRNGRDSEHSPMFDIDWDANDARVVLPVLGSPLDEEIAAGAIRVIEEAGEPTLAYYDHRFPIAPGTDTGANIRAIADTQHYELAFWREASSRVNYRRFFDINTLAGVRVEDPEVFNKTHALIATLAARDEIEGLRVDHPDGLRDPRGYFEKLAKLAPNAWITVEKILEPGEALRPDWPVAGTTGYDFCNDALAVLIDPAAEDELTNLYNDFTGKTNDFAATVHEAKLKAATELLAADNARLVRVLRAEASTEFARASDAELAETIAVLAASWPVYRTYLVPGEPPSEQDRAEMENARATATAHRPDLRAHIEQLCARLTTPAEFAARFQQYTAPTTAKGVEDTAFYRNNSFIALNEVGGDPSRFAISVAEFHQRCRDRPPASMLATSTHDTKRAEDVRARLAVLSEVPEAWAERARAWRCRHHDAPISPDALYRFCQTVVGAWPIDADRLVAFMLKAEREAKRETSWLDRNETYEQSLEEFIRRAHADADWTSEIKRFVDTIRTRGRIKSITQTLLRLTCPGVPDTYQGSELWDLSLVDPDNRRPVDYAERRRLLAGLPQTPPAAIWRTISDPDDPGLSKLFTTRRALHARRALPRAFAPGAAHTPVEVQGVDADRFVAFTRSDNAGPRACVVATRLTSGGLEATLELPRTASGHAWRDVLSDRLAGAGTYPIGDVLTVAPAALFVDEGGAS